jgi:hypothetical protein
MRILAAAIVGIAWAGQGIAASPSPTVSPEEAHAGCLHTDLRPCMISLGSALWFDMNFVTAQIAKRNELDVNGRTAHRKIIVDAKLPKHRETINITLTLASPAPNDQVVKIELTLPEDPELAHTESEYDRTQLYDAVSVVLGNRCPGLDKMALYRFYENSIKPREVAKTDAAKPGTSGVTKQTMETGKIPFCGAMFSLHREAEWYGAQDPSKDVDKVQRRALTQALSTLEIE